LNLNKNLENQELCTNCGKIVNPKNLFFFWKGIDYTKETDDDEYDKGYFEDNANDRK
jgi:hypothetical protein